MVTVASVQPARGGSVAVPPTAGAGTRLRTLDGLRLLAALGVLLYHFTARWSTAWGEEPAERFGELSRVTSYLALGPELFFVISGFVILWTAWGRSVPGVVASRLARLLPAYWAALLLTSVLLLVLWPAGKDVTWGQVAVNATMLQEAFGVAHVDGVYWTLWAELRFYLLVVVLAAVGITRRRVLTFAALWPVVAALAEAAHVDWLATLLVDRYAPLFAGGMLLYLLHRDGNAPLPWLLVAANAALAVRTVVPAQTASLTRNTAFEPSPVVLGILVVGCFAAVAAVTLTRLRDADLPLLTSAGTLTYPLYLVHEHWGWWTISLVRDAVPTPVALGAAVAVSLALAWLVHHAVERRLQPVMRRGLERGLGALAGRARAVRAGASSREPLAVPSTPRATVAGEHALRAGPPVVHRAVGGAPRPGVRPARAPAVSPAAPRRPGRPAASRP